MEAKLKELIKEAILEALVEFNGLSGITTYGNPEGGSNTGANSGGTPGKGGKPKPNVGVGTFSLN